LEKSNKTMEHLSYGIANPKELLSKLKHDAEKLDAAPHPYDVFNFIITAAVLSEWIQKFYLSENSPQPFSEPTKKRKSWLIPDLSIKWIADLSCVPNPDNGVKRHIENVLSICAHTANASKHFHWRDKNSINTISQDPPIRDWYDYFFTSTDPDLYLDFQGENYGLQQIKGIILQFYSGLIEYLEDLN